MAIRSLQRSIRFTKNEWDAVVEAAEKAGIIPGSFVRKAVNRHSILTPNRRAKLTPLSDTAEVVPVANRGDPRGFV